MTASLVLTVMGPDRPGLVDSLSRVVAEHGGNWLESRMARLAGQFAGILLVEAPEARALALRQALEGLAGEGLHVVVAGGAAEASLAPCYFLTLELVGQDHPGIVRDIAHALAGCGVSIEELTTHRTSASMSGEMLFHAQARLRVPGGVAREELRQALEALADELMVDLNLEEDRGAD
ncbi:MAG TPA: ACT domain-containing protein [Candidatus Competibacteraceae bacterium]|nr:ACT domain-containing protein [Candidatus Competibacteraceae bacterium]